MSRESSLNRAYSGLVMPVPKLLVVMGVSGSGKSRLGEAISLRAGLPFIEGDELHPLSNRAKMAGGTPLDDADRWPWLDKISGGLRASSEGGGIGSVAACSALKRAYRDRLRAGVGPSLRFVFIDGDVALILRRLNRRNGHFMPPSLSASQFDALESPSDESDVLSVSARFRTGIAARLAAEWLARDEAASPRSTG